MLPLNLRDTAATCQDGSSLELSHPSPFLPQVGGGAKLVLNVCALPQPSATCILNIALPTRDGCDKFLG